MKVLLVTDLYVPAVNGVVTSTVSLKGALENLGHEVRVLTLAKDGYIDEKENIYAISSINFNKVYPGARVRLFSDRAIVKRVLKWRPDVIHTQTEFSTFRTATHLAEYLDVPVVHTYHTIYEDYTHYFSPSRKAGRKIVSSLTRKLLSDVEAVIAPTEKVRGILDRYGVIQPVSVIPTGIQLEKFKHNFSEEEKMAFRRKYDIPEDAFLFVSLGRLGKEKNIEEILSFIPLLKQDVYFLIVGDGPNRFDLKNYVDELGLNHRVRFTGMVQPDEVPFYYQVGDLFVCASTSETQGLTYIEALASGLPALCRADESIENVIIDGYTGYQYRSFKEFESCLYVLMKDKLAYTKISFDAREFVIQNYSSQAFGLRVSAIYKKAIETYYFKKQLMSMSR